MERNMDILRDILLNLEANPKINYSCLHFGRVDEILGHDLNEIIGEDEDRSKYDELVYGLNLLIKANFVEGEYITASGSFKIRGITMSGHDFLDTIRDPKVWKQTKDAGYKLGGWTLEIIKDISVAILKQKAEQIIGIKI